MHKVIITFLLLFISCNLLAQEFSLLNHTTVKYSFGQTNPQNLFYSTLNDEVKELIESAKNSKGLAGVYLMLGGSSLVVLSVNPKINLPENLNGVLFITGVITVIVGLVLYVRHFDDSTRSSKKRNKKEEKYNPKDWELPNN
jgi:hypothetical protein